MMVPRAFASSPFATSPPKQYDEKHYRSQEKRRKSSLQSREHTSPSQSPPRVEASRLKPSASPVQVPQSHQRPSLQPSETGTPKSSLPDIQSLSVPKPPLKHRQSAQNVLASTAIPIRRKKKQRPSQRIPNGDYVADFSKILLEDVRSTRESSLSSSFNNPQFDGLFGSIDDLVEGQMIVGSEGLDAAILSTRSLSTESMPSLASPADFSSTDTTGLSPPSSLVRSSSDRRFKQLASPENCAAEHPLSERSSEEEGDTTPELSISPPQRKPMMRDRKPSTFKSSLTASLKAIKSAAQSVSNYATPAVVQPDDFGGQSFFDFQPSLTDDRRPPPDQSPSPALRRYLNPHHATPPDSPAQLHFWIDHRASDPNLGSSSEPGTARPKLKIKKKYLNPSDGEASKLPPLVPLATCIPSQIRTAHASSPPVWLAPDGTPSNKQTATAMWQGTEAGLKQCEPRENRDFLRVYVCEMQMKKAKKLRDDIEGRAKMWLPPIERDRRKVRSAEERLAEVIAI